MLRKNKHICVNLRGGCGGTGYLQ